MATPDPTPQQEVSKLSNGTDTYVIRDDTARSSLAGKQDIANLVTSVSSSSTDSQYPSAKWAYDTIGDIESAINTIRGV